MTINDKGLKPVSTTAEPLEDPVLRKIIVKLIHKPRSLFD